MNFFWRCFNLESTLSVAKFLIYAAVLWNPDFKPPWRKSFVGHLMMKNRGSLHISDLGWRIPRSLLEMAWWLLWNNLDWASNSCEFCPIQNPKMMSFLKFESSDSIFVSKGLLGILHPLPTGLLNPLLSISLAIWTPILTILKGLKSAFLDVELLSWNQKTKNLPPHSFKKKQTFFWLPQKNGGLYPQQKPKGGVLRQKSEVCKQIALNEMKRKGRLEAHREVGQIVDL